MELDSFLPSRNGWIPGLVLLVPGTARMEQKAGKCQGNQQARGWQGSHRLGQTWSASPAASQQLPQRTGQETGVKQGHFTSSPGLFSAA